MFTIPLRHLARYYAILSVFVRHGLGYLVIEQLPVPQITGSGKPLSEYSDSDLAIIGVRLRTALTELGPTFIKLGQLASTRTDVLPEPIIRELAKLQDRVYPVPFEVVRRVIEQSLQKRLDSVFREFDPRPLASASLGQVHLAVLNNGDKVAVKVQRPYVREVAEIDLEIFRTLVTQFEGRKERTQGTQRTQGYPIKTVIEEFSKTLWTELDFLNEGRNTERLARFNKAQIFIIPKIYWDYSAGKVLTQEYISGIPLQLLLSASKSTSGYPEHPEHDLSLIARQISRGLLQQILQDGCFHADPHPGNILILPAGKIALIDCGALGVLNEIRRRQLADLIGALIQGNDEHLLESIGKMGIRPEQINGPRFLADVSALRVKHLKNFQGKIAIGEAIQDLIKLINQYRICLPSEFVLVGKTFLTLDGILHQLDSELTLIELLKPFTRNLGWRNFRNLWRELISWEKSHN